MQVVAAQANVGQHRIEGPPEEQEDRKRAPMRLKMLIATGDMVDQEDTMRQTVHAQVEENRNTKVRALGQRVDQATRRAAELQKNMVTAWEQPIKQTKHVLKVQE